MNAGTCLVTMMDRDGGCVSRDVVRTQSIATGEGLTGKMIDCALDVRHALLPLLVSFDSDALGTHPIREIDRRAQQGAQVTDRVCRAAQVLPTDLDDIGEQLPGALGFAHEFKDQEFTKSQRQQALKVSGHASWLSLLMTRV